MPDEPTEPVNPPPQQGPPPIGPGTPPQNPPPQPAASVEPPVDTKKPWDHPNYLCAMGVPRRCRLDLMIPAEKSIYDAMQEVESLGCHIRLTDAVNLLGQARDAVADWAEETGNIRPESAPQDATASPCPPYQQRVLDEKAALDEKIDKLDIFRAGAIFPTLPTDEQNRLNLQLSFMRSYSGVLTDRINAWTVDGAPQPATGAGEEQA